MNLFLVTALIVSVFLNVALCILLVKFRNNPEANWRQVLGLHNPLNALIWAFLAITIFLGLVAGLMGVRDL